MSPAHVWACGQCGARVVARVGAIARAFQAHLTQCPALAHRHPSAAAVSGCGAFALAAIAPLSQARVANRPRGVESVRQAHQRSIRKFSKDVPW